MKLLEILNNVAMPNYTRNAIFGLKEHQNYFFFGFTNIISTCQIYRTLKKNTKVRITTKKMGSKSLARIAIQTLNRNKYIYLQ